MSGWTEVTWGNQGPLRVARSARGDTRDSRSVHACELGAPMAHASKEDAFHTLAMPSSVAVCHEVKSKNAAQNPTVMVTLLASLGPWCLGSLGSVGPRALGKELATGGRGRGPSE